MGFPIEKRWFVHASTGCTCCNDQNFTRGPFESAQAAQEEADWCHENRILVSQYAPNGIYKVQEANCEILPDGRVLLDQHVWGPEIEDFTDNGDWRLA